MIILISENSKRLTPILPFHLFTQMSQVGLQNHRAFARVNTEEFDPEKFAKFLSKFDESKGAISIAFQRKPHR